MEKRKLDLKPVKNVKFDFFENEIELRPMLTLAEQITLINNYLSTYFEPDHDAKNVFMSEFDYFGAELSLIAEVVDMLTNVKVLSEEGSAIDIDVLFNRGLWNEVSKRVVNYPSFRAMLEHIVADIKEQKAMAKSVGSVIDNIYDEAVNFLRSASQLDEAKIDGIKENLRSLAEEMQSSPLSSLMAEAEKKPKIRKKKA